MARVGLIGENSNAYLAELINIWNEKNCAVLIDWRIPEQTALEMLREANVQVCIIEESLIPKFKGLLTEIEIISYKNDLQRKTEVVSKAIYEKYKEDYTEKEAVIIYSSGTTGKCRGIILSYYAINTNADSIIDYMKLEANACIYVVKPITHSSTLTGEILVALKCNIKLILAPTIAHPRYVLNNISKYHVTHICLNPSLVSMFIKEYEKKNYDIASLEVIYISGSILHDSIYKKAREIFRGVAINNVYGLTEAGPRVSAKDTRCDCNINSVGRAIKGVEIAIVNDYGEIRERDEIGIIHVNTCSLYSGYVNGIVKFKSLYKGWLNTGDIGYYDGNDELHIIGRLDDVIITGSHKIYPSEIEKRILEIECIWECVVVEFDYMNTTFIACVYTGQQENPANIKKVLSKHLLTYEIPHIFIWCKKLPKARNGKLLKCVVKDMIRERLREYELRKIERKTY